MYQINKMEKEVTYAIQHSFSGWCMEDVLKYETTNTIPLAAEHLITLWFFRGGKGVEGEE